MLALVLWALSLLAVSKGSSKCPGDSLIFPCTCNVINLNRTLIPATYCEGFRDLESLQEVLFEKSGDHPLVRLEVLDASINFLPAAALKKKSIRQLLFQWTFMVGLFDRTPEENHKLQYIDLTRCRFLRGIEWEMFKNFHNLTKIMMEEVGIRKLGKDFRDYIPSSVKTLHLVSANISKLDDRAFSRLTNLVSLRIDKGKITTLKRSMFPVDNNVIEDMSISEHRIESLPDDMFDNMPKLIYVAFENNRFTTISETVFGKFKARGGQLWFRDNELVCDCKTLWIMQQEWKPFAQCHSPSDFKGKKLYESQLTKDDLDYCEDI